jgi:hypothetical protein
LLNGATTAPGLVGQAFAFDGVDDLLTTNLVMDYTNGVSLEVWLKLDNDRGIVIDDGGGSTLDRGFGLFVEPGGIISLSSTKEVNSVPNFFIIGPSISDGLWHHIVATWTGDTQVDGAALYVDGVKVGKTTASTSLTSGSTPYNIGWHKQIPGYYRLKGLIDEPTVYSRALNEDEVVAIYLAGEHGKCLPQPDPESKSDCKDGGWQQFGFRNQGQCIRFASTGKDSR